MKKNILSIIPASFFLIAALQLQGCKSVNSPEYLGVKVAEIDSALNDLLNNFYP
jgi:hypothetical protein